MFQSRLVEVAGTPFLNQKDPLDNGGVVDFLQMMGFNNPRPIFFQRIADMDYKLALSSPSNLRRTIDFAASAIEELELNASNQWRKDVERSVRASLKYNHSPRAVVTTLRYYLATSDQISKLARKEKQPDKSTNPRLRVLSGGIFQALVVNEVARQQGTISDQEAGKITQRLSPLAHKEDLTIVNLVDPGMIARIKVRVPGFNDAHFPSEKEEVRRNSKINDVALATASLYGHHFTRVEVHDMRKQTARVSTRREFEEIYAGQTIFTTMALFPELSRQFASMLVS